MVKLPTPSTAHLTGKLNTTIYEPAEDSYLFLDTFSSAGETAFLRERFPRRTPAPLALELGTGSGVIIAFLTAHSHTIFNRRILTLGADVNLEACLGTQQTVSTALDTASESQQLTPSGAPTPEGIEAPTATDTGTGTYLASLCADLTTPLRPNEVDILIFNPPYVPSETLPALPTATATPSDTDTASTTADPQQTKAQRAHAKFERESHLLALTYAGGADGMETTDRLLGQLPTVLSARGMAYVLLCAQNRPAQVVERLRKGAWGCAWRAEIVGETGGKGGWERLVVVRIWREGGTSRDDTAGSD